jgi:hypothetical protein
MRTVKVALVALAVALLPAMALAQKVSTDHDPKANFPAFKTYAWTKGTPSPNPLGEERIHELADAQLAAKGLKKVEANPDVIVASHVVLKEEKELYTTGYGGPYRWGGGMGTTTVNTYTVGTLAIDMYDFQAKKLAWRGVATDTVSDKPEKNTEKVRKSLEKMFKDYPPKAK